MASPATRTQSLAEAAACADHRPCYCTHYCWEHCEGCGTSGAGALCAYGGGAVQHGCSYTELHSAVNDALTRRASSPDSRRQRRYSNSLAAAAPCAGHRPYYCTHHCWEHCLTSGTSGAGAPCAYGAPRSTAAATRSYAAPSASCGQPRYSHSLAAAAACGGHPSYHCTHHCWEHCMGCGASGAGAPSAYGGHHAARLQLHGDMLLRQPASRGQLRYSHSRAAATACTGHRPYYCTHHCWEHCVGCGTSGAGAPFT